MPSSSSNQTDNTKSKGRSFPRRATKRNASPQKVEQIKEASGDDDNKIVMTDETLSYRWMDEGVDKSDGTVEHQLLESVVNGIVSLIRVGDSILLNSGDEDEEQAINKIYKNDDKEYYANGGEDYPPVDAFVARVEQMWEDPELGREHEDREMRMMIRARWYFKKQDVLALRGNLNGPIGRQQLLSNMTNRDLLMSNQADENDVLTILGKCTVVQRRPRETTKERLPLLPQGAFVCRYGINFGSSAPGTALLTPYEGEDDEWPSEEPPKMDESSNSKKESKRGTSRKRPRPDSSSRRNNSVTGEDDEGQSSVKSKATSKLSKSDTAEDNSLPDNTTTGECSDDGCDRPNSSVGVSAMSSDSESESCSSSFDRGSEEEKKPPETEGSTTTGKIKIGPNHQAVTEPFESSNQLLPRSSRNPVQVWKQNAIEDGILNTYYDQAATILTTYLEQNEMLAEEPYTPFPQARAEAKMLADGIAKPLTISRVSTSSCLSSCPNKLTRECKADSLLEVLHKHKYDTTKALAEIKSSPRSFLNIWTRGDKELFDTGFRRYSGSLRMISKNIDFSKGVKEVIDYHYRFKIPDQFRRYQEKKRDQSVRMMECIETRRYHDSLVPGKVEKSTTKTEGQNAVTNGTNVAPKKQVRDWTKTSTAELIGKVEERRSKAKDLLREVHDELGAEKLRLVAEAIKSYQARSIPEVKEELDKVLEDQPVFAERFNAFLPKKFRKLS